MSQPAQKGISHCLLSLVPLNSSVFIFGHDDSSTVEKSISLTSAVKDLYFSIKQNFPVIIIGGKWEPEI